MMVLISLAAFLYPRLRKLEEELPDAIVLGESWPTYEVVAAAS
jgi:hypothetical protein